MCEGPESLTMSPFRASQYTFDLKATFPVIPLVIFLCFLLNAENHLNACFHFKSKRGHLPSLQVQAQA